jgi:hypothetical protein
MAFQLLNPQEFADFLEECFAAKDGYILCTYGQAPKSLSEWYYSGQYSGSQLVQARKWKATCERVFDCQGLEDGFETQKRGRVTNVRARNNYADYCSVKGKGRIPDEYKVPGAAVFHNNGSSETHVAFLVKPVDPKKPNGDWWLIEARGVMYGVVKYKYSARSTFNRWGLMDKRFDYSAVLQLFRGAAPVQQEFVLGSRDLKRGDSGPDVTDLQAALVQLGYDLGDSGAAKNGVDNDFGKLTETAVKAFQAASYDLKVDGVYGAKTHAALMDALDELEAEEAKPDPIPEKTITIADGTWWVRKGPNTTYGRITSVRGGTKFTVLSEAENGWKQIEVGGELGFVSGKAVA